MYFKTYTPSTKSENCETARAFHTYNAVRNFCGKDKPRFPDFVAYRLSKMGMEGFFIELIPEEMSAFEASLKPEWADIKEAVRNAGQPLHSQYVAYFALLENGMKPGETKDIVQRYSNINRDTSIRKMWYINVESKEQARAAEHALHMIFDHARCMSRQQNKKDYYECDPESAEKFLTASMKKIFELIVAEVAKVEG